MITKSDFPNNCHWCEFRHSGCTYDEVMHAYESCACERFIPGKCYYCAIQQSMSDEDRNSLMVCDHAFYPDGCCNFKEGKDYDIFLQYIEELDQESRSPSDIIEKDLTRAHRRASNLRHKNRLKLIANISNYPGPYMSQVKNRVINPGRGKHSKYLKKCSNRKIRRLKSCPMNGGKYKRVFEYWWGIS